MQHTRDDTVNSTVLREDLISRLFTDTEDKGKKKQKEENFEDV